MGKYLTSNVLECREQDHSIISTEAIQDLFANHILLTDSELDRNHLTVREGDNYNYLKTQSPLLVYDGQDARF